MNFKQFVHKNAGNLCHLQHHTKWAFVKNAHKNHKNTASQKTLWFFFLICFVLVRGTDYIFWKNPFRHPSSDRILLKENCSMNIKLEDTQVATDVFFIKQYELICIAQFTYSNKGHIIGLYVELVTFFSSPSTISYVAAATSQLASNFFSHALGARRVLILDSSTRCCSRNVCVKTGCVSQSVVLCFIYSNLDDKRLAFTLMYVY